LQLLDAYNWRQFNSESNKHPDVLYCSMNNDNDGDIKRYRNRQLVWLGIYTSIGLAIVFLLPFPIDLILSTAEVSSITVTAALYDSSDKLITTEGGGFADVSTLPPGDDSAFSITLLGADEDIDHYRLLPGGTP
jgi:hypothetical protein